MIIGILCSCNKNNDDDINLKTEIIGNWKLTQMSGNFPNSETKGIEMEWQESYFLNANGTFKKYRERNGVITEASGTYNLVNSSTENLIEFVYQNQNEIIGSCYFGIPKEEMRFQSNNILFSNWEQCDGPSLKYEKIK